MASSDGTDAPLTIKRIHLWAPSIVAVVVAATAWYSRGRDVDELKSSVAAIEARMEKQAEESVQIRLSVARIEVKLGLPAVIGPGK